MVRIEKETKKTLRIISDDGRVVVQLLVFNPSTRQSESNITISYRDTRNVMSFSEDHLDDIIGVLQHLRKELRK